MADWNTLRFCFALSTQLSFLRTTRERLEAFIRVFTNIILDLFGTFSVVIGRWSSKRYGLLITCLSSRAVHLKTLDSMDVDSFIMALSRIISICGCPKVNYSDNGTSLLAGEKEFEQGICGAGGLLHIGARERNSWQCGGRQSSYGRGKRSKKKLLVIFCTSAISKFSYLTYTNGVNP
jgi:hypothetical protein